MLLTVRYQTFDHLLRDWHLVIAIGITLKLENVLIATIQFIHTSYTLMEPLQLSDSKEKYYRKTTCTFANEEEKGNRHP